MNLRKAVAVAALAVVGVVGGASAQGWSLNGTPDIIGTGTAAAPEFPGTPAVKNNLVGDKAVAPVDMHVTYKVELKAEMVGIGPGLTGVDLADLVVPDADINEAPKSGEELLKFGLLQVTTNYPGWDIGLTTKAGGVLTTDGGKAWRYDTTMVGTFPNLSQKIDSTEVSVAGDSLITSLTPIAPATSVPARVQVFIGVVDLTSQTAPIGIGETEITVAQLEGSVVADTGKPVSFVDVFAASTNTDIDTVTVGRRALGTPYTGSLATVPNVGMGMLAAADRGFGPTALTLNAGATFNGTTGAQTRPPSTDSEMFYISVRITDTNFKAIAGNPEGEYSETFTFTMYAAY